MITTAREFIAVKGVEAIREATGKEPGAIRLWKFRNRIPRDAWPELMEAFPEELSLEVLKRMMAEAA